MTRNDRRMYARSAEAHPCPYRMGGGRCTKANGICSFRIYEDDKGVAVPISITETGLQLLCPRRFEEDMTIFHLVGEVVLDTSAPAIATEIGFLRAKGRSAHIGRIDMVPASLNAVAQVLDWCALEIQAVNFPAEQWMRRLTATGLMRANSHLIQDRHAGQIIAAAAQSA